MGKLQPRGDLAAAEVAFYSPALVIGVFVVLRHGFSRQLGWFYIVTLSILRLIGASCTLYSETQNDYSTGLLTAAAITSAIGTAPLLLALMGFLSRIHQGMNSRQDQNGGSGIHPMVWRGLQLLPLVALIVAIIGGVDESSNPPSSSTGQTGHKCMEAASILFFVEYLVLAAIAVVTFFQASRVLSAERKLLYASVASVPFLLVRVIFTVIVSFSSPSSDFYFLNVSVWAEAFMQFLMEAIVVTLFITAGLLTPKQVPNRDAYNASSKRMPTSSANRQEQIPMEP